MGKELLKAEAMDCVNKMVPERRVIAFKMLTSVFSRDSQFVVRELDINGLEVRTCTKCNRTLTLDGFTYRASRPRSLCKDCEPLHGKLYGIKSIKDSTRGRIGLYAMLKLLDLYGPYCPDCGIRMCSFVSDGRVQGPDDVTVDHIIPYSLWKTDQQDDLRLCCRRCNSKKGDNLYWHLIEQFDLIPKIEKLLTNQEMWHLNLTGSLSLKMFQAA